MQNPSHNPATFPKEGGGHFAKIETRMKIILEDQPNPVFNDPFVREIANKARVDLDHIKYLIEHYGFRFDKNSSKGWLGELFSCVDKLFFSPPGTRVTVGGKDMSPAEAVNDVWHPKKNEKGEQPDIVVQGHSYSVSPDQNDSLLVTFEQGIESKNRFGDYTTGSKTAGDNKSVSAAERAKHAQDNSAYSEETTFVSGGQITKKQKQDVSNVSYPSDVSPKTGPKDSPLFHDQTTYDLDEESTQAMDEAINYLSNVPPSK